MRRPAARLTARTKPCRPSGSDAAGNRCTIKNKAEAAYARSDLFEKRRELVESWAEYPTA